MRADARHFTQNETQFHLGFLPTEQPNPLTRGMDAVFARSCAEGARLLLGADRAVAAAAPRVFASEAFAALAEAMRSALRPGGSGRVVFSGCGATGRLAVLLETMWRRGVRASADAENLRGRVAGIITGGDFALVRSVESFEDCCEFGREQARALGVGPGDCFVAVSEGGETSSVIGSLMEAAERGARCFFLFNNPAELLRGRILRSRRALDDPRVTALELFSGPMALAGSTRMQAATFEMLVAGAALEGALSGARQDYAALFTRLLDVMEGGGAITRIAAQIALEERVYRAGGLVTYYADSLLLDVFTDTTERTPTFMTPGFKKAGDAAAPPPWAFAKHRSAGSDAAWEALLLRAPRCLEWTAEDYRRLGAPQRLIDSPPAIGAAELGLFHIGAEADAERAAPRVNAGALALAPGEARTGADAALLARHRESAVLDFAEFGLPQEAPGAALGLMDHIAVKIFFNTVSTGVMARLGRVSGNWMSFVSASNKKLVDRAARLVSDLSGAPYEEAADAVFSALEESARGAQKRPPVQMALEKIKAARGGAAG